MLDSSSERSIDVRCSMFRYRFVPQLELATCRSLAQTEAAGARVNESMQEFLDDLEHLPDLSKEELAALSEKVKKYHVN